MPPAHAAERPSSPRFGPLNFSHLLLAGILLLAAYLRLWGLQYSEVAGDQSVLLSIAMRWVNGGMLPLAANKSSAGIMNPPLIENLLALPLFIRPTITAAQLFQALLSWAAIPILYVYAARLFNRRVALLAALLFAVNPWAVFYGRFIWNPNPIPFFSTLLLVHLLTYFVEEKRPYHLALSFLWLAAITQLHLSGLALVAVMALLLIIFWRRRQRDNWRAAAAPLLAGLLLALLLYAPFIEYQRAVGFADLQTMANALRGGRIANAEVGPPVTNSAAWLLTQELTAGDDFWDTTAVTRSGLFSGFWLTDLTRLLFVAALIYAIAAPLYWRVRHRQGALPTRLAAYAILALWIAAPVLLYLRHTVYLQNYYFLYLFPAPFLLLALVVDELWQRLAAVGRFRRRTQLLLISPLLLIALWQLHIGQTMLNQLATGAAGPRQQARHIEATIAAGRDLLAQHPDCDLTIVTAGGSLESSRLGVVQEFVYPTPVRYVDADRGYIWPETCTIYLTAVSNPLVDAFLQEHGQPLPPEVRAGEESWRFHRVPGRDTVAAPPLAAWKNGLALVDVAVEEEPQPGQPLLVNYTWQVTAVPDQHARTHFFNHFLDAEGNLVAQEDAPAINSLYWRPGDQIVTRFYLPMPGELPDGRYTLLTGLYTWPDLQRISLTNGETIFPAAELAVTQN